MTALRHSAIRDRVGPALNRALHELMDAEPGLVMLGEDITDPYGGAFGITRGLSTDFPGRVRSTPISEAAMAGMAAGLALAGDPVIIEVMFGDFIALCFDPILNLLSKSVSMYGRRLRVPVVIRCPVGGGRGYGATHSQSPQQHFLGIPHLSLYELSPLHPVASGLRHVLSQGEPAILFENKVLYTQPQFGHDPADDIFTCEPIADADGWTRVSAEDGDPDWVIIAPGGVARRALAAARAALIHDELTCTLLTPFRLCPVDIEPVLPVLRGAGRVLIAEDGMAGGGWAEQVALLIHQRLWGELRAPVRILQARRAVIPCAMHLEQQVLVTEAAILATLRRRV
jgi:pyruvate/2-oxoglutarate/acetoin dehydrogenase E1 component